MIIWITMQLFSAMFGVSIPGGAVGLVQMMGFMELLAETAGIVVYIASALYYSIKNYRAKS